MATAAVAPLVPEPVKPIPVSIDLPSGFNIQAQDSKLDQNVPSSRQPLQGSAPVPQPVVTKDPPAPLGVLKDFQGTYSGFGFNTIFRPNNSPTPVVFTNAVNPAPPSDTSDNTLELNLTLETLSFTKTLKSVPNRGFMGQGDINLNGVPYLQAIDDVTNLFTGRADGLITEDKGIHVEPGLWMNIPKTDINPGQPALLCRMASIPHGTTINAQGLAPTSTSITAGKPTIPSVDITPFRVGQPGKRLKGVFPNQTADNKSTPRIPQDLTKFIQAGTITQAVLDDPNTVLRKANDVPGKTIISSTTFTVTTNPSVAGNASGTANIDFLQGKSPQPGPNANAVEMTAQFWINTVEYILDIPVWKPGDKALELQPRPVISPSVPSMPGSPAPVAAPSPTFVGTPAAAITTPRTRKVTSTEIQYSQTVNLVFNNLVWPHVSVATLVKTSEQSLPPSVFS